MAVTIDSRIITDLLRPSSNVNFSLFAVGEPIKIEIAVTCYTKITFTTQSQFQTTDAFGAIYSSGSRFAGINVGDTLKFTDATYPAIDGQYTVVSKFSDSSMVLSAKIGGSYMASGISSSTTIIENLTPITGIGMPFGFIENNESISYNSKVTNQYQRLWADNLDASDTTTHHAMQFDSGVEYTYGGAYVVGLGWNTSTGMQRFKIVHETIVTPIYLPTQLTDTLNTIAPSYYINNACLKHIFQIEAYASINNPNSLQSTQSLPEIGNSGWFNEVYNGGLKDYSIQNISGSIPLINATSSQQIVFEVYSPNGDFNVNTNLIVSFAKAPQNNSEFINNGRDYETNFLNTNTLCSATTGGTNNVPSTSGGTYQTITNINTIRTSSNVITVTVDFDFSTDTKLIFEESATPRYLLWVTISDQNETNALFANKQALLVQFEKLEIEQLELFAIDKTYFRHYENDTDTGIQTDVTTFEEDECVMKSVYEIPTTLATAGLTITNIAQQIICLRDDGSEFILEDYQLNVPSPIFIGNTQQLAVSQPRVFQIPTSEIRKTIEVSGGVNDGTTIQWEVWYPFMIRWEYWVQLLTADPQFFDVTEPQNNLNEYWFKYGQNQTWADYTIIHRSAVTYTYLGNTYTNNEDTTIEVNDYQSNSDYTVKKVESFTQAGVSLYNSSNSRWYLLSNAPTKIKATFTKNTSINVNDCYVVFGIEIFEQGGISGRRRYSSKWATNTPLTWFIPLSGGNKIQLTQSSSTTIVAEALIDNTIIPTGISEYKIVARIYELVGDDPDAKITENNIIKDLEQGDYKIIE